MRNLRRTIVRTTFFLVSVFVIFSGIVARLDKNDMHADMIKAYRVTK
jgi:hypothetical protein